MPSQLGHDDLSRLTPILASLARLAARGSTFADAQFETLLASADVASESRTLEELRRWGRLLLALRQDPSADRRATTVEALLLRGLPEAAAELAVATVADVALASRPMPAIPAAAGRAPDAAGNPTSSPARGTAPLALEPLSVDQSPLDFGEVPLGEMVSHTLTVRGGPGRVDVDGGLLQVIPSIFGGSATAVTVTAGPSSAEGVLWTSVKFVTFSDALDVPVLARWSASAPTRLPSSAPAGLVPSSRPLVIALDGSGDHRSLAEAIDAAPEGATIRLKDGTYELDTGLLLKKPVSIVGAGQETTRITASSGDCVLRYAGSGRFELRDLTVQWTSSEPRPIDVVTVYGGEVVIKKCRFAGATSSDHLFGAGLELRGTTRGIVADSTSSQNGCGIYVAEDSTVNVRSCLCNSNQTSGMVVTDSAQPIIESNVLRKNGSCGIIFRVRGRGTARQNECVDNQATGIHVQGDAQPILQANLCEANLQAGIAYFGAASGEASDNVIAGNQLIGVYVGGNARPNLRKNIIENNKNSGISYVESAGGSAIQNRCRSNGIDGIQVTNDAAPTLDGNDCLENAEAGIGYYRGATGTAKANRCASNGMIGIFICGEAQPAINDNLCQDNKQSGIVFAESSSGTAHDNRCTGHSEFGISARGQARPVISSNTCQQNMVGIGYEDSAAGAASQNRCDGNEAAGIGLVGDVAPTLAANECGSNQGAGILCADHAAATITKNLCRHNKQSGIAFHNAASGVARQNRCEGNEECGIDVADDAQPLLEENTCRNNEGAGILYRGSANGIARENLCAGNGMLGIGASEQARPTLLTNTCDDNKQDGIRFYQNATGTARQNRCRDNAEFGIFVADSAGPILRDNICRGNRGKDVNDQRR